MITNKMPADFPFANMRALCDSKNLAAETESADKRVVRLKLDITNTGCVTSQYVPDLRNTIADYGSRVINADPDAVLSKED